MLILACILMALWQLHFILSKVLRCLLVPWVCFAFCLNNRDGHSGLPKSVYNRAPPESGLFLDTFALDVDLFVMWRPPGWGGLLLLQTLYLMKLDCTCSFLTWRFHSSNYRAEGFPPLHNPQFPAWHTLPLRLTQSNDWRGSIFAVSCQKENMALIEVYICVVLHACKTDVT